MPTNRAIFTAIYEGPALDSNSMDVYQLAPAMLALSDVLVAANKALNGDRATVKVNVHAFRDGSFGIGLEIFQNIVDAIADYLGPGKPIREALDILALLGFTVKDGIESGMNLIKLIIESHGHKPEAVTNENNVVKFSFREEGTLRDISVPQEVATLFLNDMVRLGVARVVAPVSEPGVSSLAIELGGHTTSVASHAQAEYFENLNYWEDEVVIDEKPQIRLLAIAALSFKEGNKWRLSDGENTINVTIVDKYFMNNVDKGMPFSKNDLLKVELHIKTRYGVHGLKTEYIVTKVIDIIRSPTQLWLPDVGA